MPKLTINTKCPMCTQTHHVRVDEEGYHDWLSGELIQAALPDLDVNDREMLMTVICPTCWDQEFPEDDDV